MNNCIETEKGKVHITSGLMPDKVKELMFAADFTGDVAYKSIFTSNGILNLIEKRQGVIAFAVLDNKTIVGYAILDYPDADDRWAKLDGNILMEVKAVEVKREFRHFGIARHLVLQLLAEPEIEQKIVYLVGHSWTWDVGFSDLNVQYYRDMLISLYTGVGFKEYRTNEANICLKPENFLMVRMGDNVPEQIREEFKWLCYGLVKDDFDPSYAFVRNK